MDEDYERIMKSIHSTMDASEPIKKMEEEAFAPVVEKIRTFETGATRDTDIGKLDYEGFFNPFVLERYAQYLNKHRVQSDGTTRDSDNWQKGIPMKEYIKSLLRHTVDFWKLHRTARTITWESVEDLLCAIIFNAMGYLLEILKKKNNGVL